MKHIDFIASLLRSKFVMSGMRVGYDTHDSQPTVNRRSRLTSQQRHYSVTSARVAQEWLKYAAMAVMLFTIAVGNVWGDSETITASQVSGWNGTRGAQSGSRNGFAITTTDGVYNTQLRSYAGSTFGISSSNGNMTQIVFSYSQGSLSSPSAGSISSNTWTGDAASVTFSATAQARVTQMVITYTSSGSCTECTYYVWNGSKWASIGTTDFDDVVLSPPNLPSNGNGAGNGCWTTDKNIYSGGGCSTYTTGNKFRYVPTPGGAEPDADNKPGSGVCELYAVYFDNNGCLSTGVTAPVCARIWEEPDNLVATVTSSTAATLTWDAIGGVSSYHVTVTQVSNSLLVFDGDVNTNTKSLIGLTAGTEYSWSVVANSVDDDACDSNPTEGDNFTTCASGFTSATPTIVPDATPGKTSCEVLFDCTSATSYTVTLRNNSTDAVISGYNGITNTTGDITFSGLTASTTYRVEIVAHNACGESSLQGSETFTTAEATLYTVTFHNAVGSAPSAVTQATEGGTVSIPSASACEGWNFAGWKVGESQSEKTTDPTGSGTWITSNSWPKSYTPTGNIDAYAVFSKTEGGSSPVVDEMTPSAISNPSSYTDWSDKSLTSSAVYAGQTTGGDNYLQMRTTNSNSGIVMTTSGGNVTHIEVDWNSTTTSGRTLNIYGKNSAYEYASDLYNAQKQGTLIGTIVYGTSTELDIDDDYAYIGVRSSSGALYLNEIDFTIGGGGTTTWRSDPPCSNATLDHIAITTAPTTTNYLVGQIFSSAGAVVEAYYDDDSHHSVTASWTPTTPLTAGTGQTVTASYTEGGETKTATTTINVYTPTLVKEDESGTTIDLASPGVSRSAAVVTADAKGNSYVFKEWQISGGTFSGGVTTTSTNPATITSVSGAVTVTAVYYKPITVKWYVGGSQYGGTGTYARGWQAILPDPAPDPEDYSCDDKVFYGWSRTQNYSSASTAPTDLVQSKDELTTDENFYAVFAIKEGDGTATEWTKTSLGSVTAGTYLICTPGGYAFNGTFSSGDGAKTSSAFTSSNWSKTTFNEDAPLGAQEITIAAKSSGFSMYVAGEGKGYITAKQSARGGLQYEATAGDYYWAKQTVSSTDYWRFSRDFGSGKYAFFQANGDTDFRNYNSSGTGNPITLLKKTAAGSPATYSDYSTSCACDGFSFHTGTGTDNEVKETNNRICFKQEGSSTTWKIDNYVIPSDTKFFVGYQDAFKDGTSGHELGTSSRSSVQTWAAEMYLENMKTNGDGSRPTVGAATGAVGTLSIWSDNDWNNCHVGFQPNGYGITYTDDSNNFGFTATGTANKLETDVVTLPDVSSTEYTMGLATATDGVYVTCGHSSAAEPINAMGVSINTGGKKKILLVPGSFNAAGAKYAVYDVTNTAFDTDFMTDADGDGVWEGYVGSNCTEMILCRMNSDATTSDLSNKNWDKRWNQTANITIGDLLQKYTITNMTTWNACGYTTTAMHPAMGERGKFRMWDNSTSKNWYVHFVPYYRLSYNPYGGQDEPSPSDDVPSEGNVAARTIAISSTEPTKDGYRFMGWATSTDRSDAGTVDYKYGTANDEVVLTDNMTLYAVWVPTYTVTYNLDGGSASPVCSGGSYIQGETVTVCASTPTKPGYDFNGWSYSPSVTVTTGTFPMPASDVTITATWREAEYNLNHSGSNYTNTENKTKIKSSDTPLELNYTCTGTYAFPKSIGISGGGKASWTVNTDYTWTVDDNKQAAQLVINSTTISADVTITITMQTRYIVIWDEHGNTTTEYKAADDNTVTEKTGIAACGEKAFYRWTEDAEFVSDDDTPPAAATFGTITGDKHYYAIYADATVPANPGYEKITSGVTAGTYLIATASGTAYTGKVSGQAYGGYTSCSVSEGVIASQGSACEVTITMSGSNFYMNDGTYYLGYSGSSNDLKFDASKQDGNKDLWKLDANGQIESVNVSGRKLEYNSGSPRFACYTGSGVDAFLYKKQTTTYENFSKTCQTYNITITTPSGGTVTTTPTAGTGVAGEGQEITVNVTPDACKYLSALKYNDGSSDHAISIASTPYKFNMPAADVEVTATFSSKSVTGIEAITSSHRILMQNSAFVGEQIRVSYSNGETEDIACDNAALTFTGYSMSTLGDQTVSVSYTSSCGNASTSYGITITDGIIITFSDCGNTTDYKYNSGELVPVETTNGAYACSGWEFVGWSETSVADNSTSFTPVRNFNASTAKTLYAVYAHLRVNGSSVEEYESADMVADLKEGARYVLATYVHSSHHEYGYTALLPTVASTNYLNGTHSGSSGFALEEVKNAANSYIYHTTATFAANTHWQLEADGSGYWQLYNTSTRKYLDLSGQASGYVGVSAVSTKPSGKIVISNVNESLGDNDSQLHIKHSTASDGKRLTWDRSNNYFNQYAAQSMRMLTKDEYFTSTPPCAPKSAIFHGSGGTVTAYGGSPTGDKLTVTEAVRDEGITTPTAAFADCSGKSWVFMGWLDEQRDLTRVPVLITELLNNGGGNKHHDITNDGEEFWAVYSSTGEKETKYGRISFTMSDWGAAPYSDGSLNKTVSGDTYTFTYVQVGHQSNLGIQINHDVLNRGYIQNTTSLGKINSISFSNFGAGSIDAIRVYVGNSADAVTTLLTAADLQTKDGVSTYYPADNYEYVKIMTVSYAPIGNIDIDFGKETIVYGTKPDCSTITLGGDVYVTSRNGVGVMAASTLTVEASNMTPRADVVITSNSSDVYFTTDRAHNFAMAAANQPKNSVRLTADGTGELGETEIYVHYKPSSDGTGAPADVTVYANVDPVDPEVRKEHTIHVRNLPETVVIAAKVGTAWYALNGNMSTACNPKAVQIEVDESTWTAYAADTFAYKLWPVKTTNGGEDRYQTQGEKLRFAAVNNKTTANGGLWGNDNASANTIKDYAAISALSDGSDYTQYEWKITTAEAGTTWKYTLQMDQGEGHNNNKLNLHRGADLVWGTYTDGSAVTDELYLLTLSEIKAFEFDVVEWYPTKMLIQTNNTVNTSVFKAYVDGTEVTSPAAACASKGSKLYEVTNLPLTTANATKSLKLKYTDTPNDYVGITNIPIIISQGTKNVGEAPFTTLTPEVYKDVNLVVRDGAVLTLNGTDAANTFNDVTIHPTSKISVASGKKMSVHKLTFFGGIDEVYDGSSYSTHKYDVPELSLKGTLKKSVSAIDYVMRVDQSQMYSLAVPYDVTLNKIKYWDGTAITLGTQLWVSAYDGAARASKDMENTWVYEVNFDPATLLKGVGYTISADMQSGVGNEYAIIRLPMAGHTTNTTEAAKTVAVTAHGLDADVTPNHKGWNLVGNPYMASISGSTAGGADDSKIVVGYLNENAGTYEWVEDTYRYVTIPDNDGKGYTQTKWSDATLPPFKNFFIQVGTTGDLAFALGSRADAPARQVQAQKRETEFEILLAGDTRQDHTGLLIGEQYSPAYEINADLEKMENKLSVYTLTGGYKLAYNALSEEDAKQPIPVGYIADVAGTYTFMLDERAEIDALNHVWLTDYELDRVTDLRDFPYAFTTAKGRNETRFALTVELNEQVDVTTDTAEPIPDPGDAPPVKFIYDDKLYILNHGILYDATGKRVNGTQQVTIK